MVNHFNSLGNSLAAGVMQAGGGQFRQVDDECGRMVHGEKWNFMTF